MMYYPQSVLSVVFMLLCAFAAAWGVIEMAVLHFGYGSTVVYFGGVAGGCLYLANSVSIWFFLQREDRD